MDARQIKDDLEWRQIVVYPCGGLTEIGLSADERHLLVISASGRGVIETSTGKRVARDYVVPRFDSEWIRMDRRLVKGIGPIADEWVSAVGLWGGMMSSVNPRNWLVNLEKQGPSENVYIENQMSGQHYLIDIPFTEVRALGFSKSGRLLVFATSSEVVLYENVT